MEPLWIVVLVAAGMWPLWAAAGAAGLRAWRLLLVGVGVAVTVASFVLAFRAQAPDETPPTDRPIVVRDEADGFVSSDTCRACHPRFDASWRASYHRRMTQQATPDRIIPSIDSHEFAHDGDRLRLEQRDGRVWAGIAQPGPEGTTRWVEREVVQTTGSHHFQAFWFSSGRGRELTLFPICYRVDEARWMPVDAAFLMPPDTRQSLGGARWNTNCVLCHTTQGRPRVHDPETVDTQVAEFGIGCESCHGPAARHVADNRDPARRYALHLDDARDPTIRNPLRMAPERQAEVCGQCHAVTIARAELQDVWARDGFTYRPGDELAATRLVLSRAVTDAPELSATLARRPDFFDTIFWPDGQVRISGRDYHGLIASPCYVDGEGARKMTCLSCHTMHPASDDPRSLSEWADDQLKPGMRGDRACTQCHEEYVGEAAVREHTRHEPESASCYDCHMPYTTFGLLKAIRSHTVTSPTVQETVESGRPNACNLCHLDRTLAWTAEHLLEDWETPAPDLDDDQREVAAAILWALRGDAGARALVAAAMGNEAARAASGTDWMTPYLAELLRDPYHAVRFVAQRALRTDPVGAELGYDFLAPAAQRDAVVRGLEEDWMRQRATRRGADLSRLLIDSVGDLRVDVFRRLLLQRDNRRVYLGE